MDPNILSKFFAAPDATQIVEAFAVIPEGKFRAGLVSHLTTMSAALPVEQPAPAPEVPLLPPYDPDWRSKVKGALLSESKNGRVVERHRRGEYPSRIALKEKIPVEEVHKILQEAGIKIGAPIKRPRKGSAVQHKARLRAVQPPQKAQDAPPPSDPAPPPPAAHDAPTGEQRGLETIIFDRAVELRLAAVGPSDIAAQLTRDLNRKVSPNTVSNAIWRARKEKKIVFPKLTGHAGVNQYTARPQQAAAA